MSTSTSQAPGAVHPDITEALVRTVIATFYDRARRDEVIGPIFVREVGDWDRHIAAITDFWSGMLLRTSRYDGRPLRPHLLLGLQGEHFDRWLGLFDRTVRDLCTPEIADIFLLRARRIADSFEMAIASTRGEIAAPRHAGRAA